MESLSWLRHVDLVMPVRRLLGGDVVTIDAWSAEPIAGGAGETLGVWRVSGDATVDGVGTPFALILKGRGVAARNGDPTAWDWPHRELRACASGLLDDLPGGIAAPRCLGEVERSDGTTWAWMSPMSTGALDAWDREHFALVARRLGQFNGAYLTGRPLPEAEFLSRQWTRKWTEAAREAIEQIDRYVEHPLVARAFPSAERREIQRLFAERHRWFDGLDALPQTFCHLDAFPRNAFLRPCPDGEVSLSLIDWSFTGVAAIGEEIAPLVSASVAFGHAPSIPYEELDAQVFTSYLDGLRDAGWTGDERLARMGYTGSLVMRYVVGPLRLVLPMLANDQFHSILEQVFGMSIDELADRKVTHDDWAFTLADEFREYLDTIPPRLSGAA